jgi:hypothetical protein
LDWLARLYGRSAAELLEPTPMAPDPVSTLLRASHEIAKDHALEQKVRGYWRLCGEVDRLERELAPDVVEEHVVSSVPASRQGAAAQGAGYLGRLADDEFPGRHA